MDQKKGIDMDKAGPILDALMDAGGDRVYTDELKKIDPDFKTHIRALKEAGVNVRGFQDKESGRIFYVLPEDEAEDEREDAPQGIARPATSPASAQGPAPAAPTSATSPAESPGKDDRHNNGEDAGVTVNISDLIAKTYPKTGRVKIEGWIEDPDERILIQEFLVRHPGGDEGHNAFVSTGRITTEADDEESVPQESPDDESAVEAPEVEGEEVGDLDEGPAPEETPDPVAEEVPIYDDNGKVIGYRQAGPKKPEKSPEDIKKEVRDSGISSSAAQGMESLMDRGGQGPVNRSI